jgi:hypothetical protein
LKYSYFFKLGVNLTADGDTGQLDAYVKNAEWDLEGIPYLIKSTVFLILLLHSFYCNKKSCCL